MRFDHFAIEYTYTHNDSRMNSACLVKGVSCMWRNNKFGLFVWTFANTEPHNDTDCLQLDGVSEMTLTVFHRVHNFESALMLQLFGCPLTVKNQIMIR